MGTFTLMTLKRNFPFQISNKIFVYNKTMQTHTINEYILQKAIMRIKNEQKKQFIYKVINHISNGMNVFEVFYTRDSFVD